MDRMEWLLWLGKQASKSDTAIAHAMLHAVAVAKAELERALERG